jgi:tripartite-type tricarboxylate transporter receptor subunit TctC
LEQLPNVPTVAELGYADLLDIVSMYRPVGAPPGLPDAIAKVWYDAFWNATNDPEFQKKMRDGDRNVYPMTPKETADIVDRGIIEVEKYKDLILKHRK